MLQGSRARALACQMPGPHPFDSASGACGKCLQWTNQPPLTRYSPKRLPTRQSSMQHCTFWRPKIQLTSNCTPLLVTRWKRWQVQDSHAKGQPVRYTTNHCSGVGSTRPNKDKSRAWTACTCVAALAMACGVKACVQELRLWLTDPKVVKP
ncbi:hypothetical protein ABBQ32_010842 [Trebouxia sp. C0010 RCD-2024]